MNDKPCRRMAYHFAYHFVECLKSDSDLQKKLFYFLQWKPFKLMKNAFYFMLKSLFVLMIFTFLSWLFGNVGKTTWLER